MEYSSIVALLLILLIWLPWILRYFVRPHYAREEQNQWLSQHPNRLFLKKCLRVFENLFGKIQAKQISISERKRLGLDSDMFIYGEVEFLSFAEFMEAATPHVGEVFYDLGCGSGKAVYSAALIYDFRKVCGIELLPGLYNLANSLKSPFHELVKKYIGMNKNVQIQFINDDIIKANISDADIVFINATCFLGELWAGLLDKMDKLKIGTRVVLMTKEMNSPFYKKLYEKKHLMSWGMATVRVYTKIS